MPSIGDLTTRFLCKLLETCQSGDDGGPGPANAGMLIRKLVEHGADANELSAVLIQLGDEGARHVGLRLRTASESDVDEMAADLLGRVRGSQAAPVAKCPNPEPQRTKQTEPEFFCISCQQCSKNLRVKATAAGKKVKCPHCQRLFSVPHKQIARPAEAVLPTNTTPAKPTPATKPAPALPGGSVRKSPGDTGAKAKDSAAALPLRSTIKLQCKVGESGHQFESLGLIGEGGIREKYTEHWRVNEVTVCFPEDAASEETIMCPTCMGNVKVKIVPETPVTLPVAIGMVTFVVLAAGSGLWWIPTLEGGWHVTAIAVLWVLLPLIALGAIASYKEQSSKNHKPKATVTIIDDCGYVEGMFDPPSLIRANRRHKLEGRKCTRGV